MQLFLGVVYLPLARASRRTYRLLAKPSREIELSIDDAGITLREPLKLVPWKRISEIRDLGEAFVAIAGYGRSIPIFKRALPDGGAALWASLDGKLTSTRYLVRGTGSRLTISNQAARR